MCALIDPSPHFLAFQESVTQPIQSSAAMASYNLAALALIRDEELARALELLQTIAETSDDPRVVDALVALQTDKALGVLEALGRGQASFRTLRAAMRLWELGRRASARAGIATCLASSNSEVQTTTLTILGRLEGGPDEPLFDALRSTLFEVRQRAKDALFFKYQLDEFDNLIPSSVYHLSLGVASSFPALYEDAARELESLIEAIREGQTTMVDLREEGGDGTVSQAIQELWDAVDTLGEGLTPNVLEGLSDGELKYATEFLSRSLEGGGRHVVPRLQSLGTRRADLVLSCIRTA